MTTLYSEFGRFESSVNSEGIETTYSYLQFLIQFESSVNSEGIETDGTTYKDNNGLRAV